MNVKKILYMGISLLLSIFLGTALMIGVFLLPTQRIEGHLQESIPLLVNEFDNSNVIYDYPSTLTGLFTDCIMLENAVYRSEGHSVVQEAMEVYRGEKQEEYWTPGEALLSYLNGEKLPAEVTYGRYWHGYLVLLMPMLSFLSVGELRMLGVLLQGLMCMAVVWGFYRQKKMEGAMVFCFTVLWMMPLSMMLSLSLSVCFYLMTAGVLCILFFGERLNRIGYEWLFLFLGIMTAYFDFLTYPLVTLGIPLCVWVMLQERKEKNTVVKLMGNGLSWGAGYGIMWAGKWVMGDLLAGSGIIKDALSTLTARTGAVEEKSRLDSFLIAVQENLGVVVNPPYLIMALAVLIVICWRLVVRHQKTNGGKEISIQHNFSSCKWELICYGMLAILPFGWFLVTANHSAEHWMFTFRILGISVFALLSGAVCLMNRKGKPGFQ